MKHVLLSSFGSADWVPLLFPLVAIVVVYYTVDYGIKRYKEWKLKRQSEPAEEESFEHSTNN